MLKDTKPNIFQLATKELTQDSFLAWLLQWANDIYADFNSSLNETAQDFVRLLIDQDDKYRIIKVDAGRQWKNVDVWAEINEEYFLCIEDKTNTGEHSNQLQRYKELVAERFKGKNHTLKFIYLKTGNESSFSLKMIQEKGYRVVNRKSVLQILNKREVNNEIFNDFKSYLTTIEHLTSSYETLKSINSNLNTAEGFYIKLQELIPEWTDWKYVPNKTGGFLGFWYHWVKGKNFDLYIQIENIIGKKIQVNIKIGNWNPKMETLNEILAALQLGAGKYALQIIKPVKYRLGKTSTLGIVNDIFISDKDGNMNLNQLLIHLQNLQSLLDEYVSITSITYSKTIHKPI